MLSIGHIATGALIAHYIPNPMVYVPLTLASHFVADWIPHWDCGTGMGTQKTKRLALAHEALDLVLSIIFISIVFGSTNIHIWLAALIAILPDLIEAPENFLNIKLKILTPINKFHERWHHSQPNLILGLTPQLVLLFIVYLIA